MDQGQTAAVRLWPHGGAALQVGSFGVSSPVPVSCRTKKTHQIQHQQPDGHFAVPRGGGSTRAATQPSPSNSPHVPALNCPPSSFSAPDHVPVGSERRDDHGGRRCQASSPSGRQGEGVDSGDAAAGGGEERESHRPRDQGEELTERVCETTCTQLCVHILSVLSLVGAPERTAVNVFVCFRTSWRTSPSEPSSTVRP